MVLQFDDDLNVAAVDADWWTVNRGFSPVLATAIHNGHTVRRDLEGLMAISSDERLREEDPFTEFVIRDVPNRIVVPPLAFRGRHQPWTREGSVSFASTGLGNERLERATHIGSD